MSEENITLKDVYILSKSVKQDLTEHIENLEITSQSLTTAIQIENQNLKEKVKSLEEENNILKVKLERQERKIELKERKGLVVALKEARNKNQNTKPNNRN
ncbi:unnamed protein product [Psylliodes chrysocephalus]|uniref:Uncharacterized protein n=1 Tax=Psylliodes chrysocephalus TaxID=3402493 RepID=A0A9P0CQX8_9CUCU|nr:unnamed protein product [Psylliodes chrysocephala]